MLSHSEKNNEYSETKGFLDSSVVDEALLFFSTRETASRLATRHTNPLQVSAGFTKKG